MRQCAGQSVAERLQAGRPGFTPRTVGATACLPSAFAGRQEPDEHQLGAGRSRIGAAALHSGQPPPAWLSVQHRGGESRARRADEMREIDDLKRQAIAEVDRWAPSLWEAAQTIARN